METVKTFKAAIGEMLCSVKAVRVDDPTGAYWMVTASEILRLLNEANYPVVMEAFMVQDGIAAVTVREPSGAIFAVGSCLIGKEHGNDPVGIAHRRAINNYAFQTGLFDDVFDKLRELNKGTLDHRKGDVLNDSVTKMLGL